MHRTILIRIALATSAPLCLTALSSPAQEQQRPSAYYEDAWDDIAEWIDGTDQRSVDANLGQPEDDWSSPSTDEYWWGYDDRADDDDWFYDYYDDGFTTYFGGDEDGYYSYAWSYYDYDQDGYYDAYDLYWDSDNDGIYDSFDYHVIDDVATARQGRGGQGRQPQERPEQRRAERSMQQTSDMRRRRSAQRRQVNGIVVNAKNVAVRDTDHRVVKLRLDDGRTVLADLGPAADLRRLDLQNGDPLAVRGPAMQVGERRIVVARQLRAGGRTYDVERRQTELRGTIAGLRTFEVRGTERQMAILDTGARRWILDLGPRDALETELNRGEHLTAWGVPCKKQEQLVMLADSFEVDETRFRVDRSAALRGMQQRDRDRRSGGAAGAADSSAPSDQSTPSDRSEMRGANRGRRLLRV